MNIWVEFYKYSDDRKNTHAQMKERVINYLEYMEEKDLQEIAATLYNLSKRRAEIKQRKDNGG